MPELPDILVYAEALRRLAGGRVLLEARLHSPFVLRSVGLPAAALAQRTLVDVTRLGKRLVLHLSGGAAVVIHLMVAGRLHWEATPRPRPTRQDLATFVFAGGSLRLTEAGHRRRASLHFEADAAGLEAHRRGGLDVLGCSPAQFTERLRAESHTLKRALTDPRLFDGIGNAYADEILHRARMPPTRLSGRLDDAACAQLHAAAAATLALWIGRLRAACGDGFPQKVTAFRPEMAVHGRFGQPCPDCGSPVQRIVYAENETNYCPACQNGGRLLADRGLSRLLKDDWPRSLEALEAMPGRLLRR